VQRDLERLHRLAALETVSPQDFSAALAELHGPQLDAKFTQESGKREWSRPDLCGGIPDSCAIS
jgi:hypothetical protein